MQRNSLYTAKTEQRFLFRLICCRCLMSFSFGAASGAHQLPYSTVLGSSLAVSGANLQLSHGVVVSHDGASLSLPCNLRFPQPAARNKSSSRFREWGSIFYSHLSAVPRGHARSRKHTCTRSRRRRICHVRLALLSDTRIQGWPVTAIPVQAGEAVDVHSAATGPGVPQLLSAVAAPDSLEQDVP